VPTSVPTSREKVCVCGSASEPYRALCPRAVASRLSSLGTPQSEGSLSDLRCVAIDDEAQRFTLKPGSNEVSLEAPISAAETDVRYTLLVEDGRLVNALRAGRLYHHPDARQYGCPPAEYAKDILAAANTGGLDNKFQILRERVLRKWRFRAGGKKFRYRNATEFTVRYEFPFGAPTTKTVHAVQAGELWKTFPICSGE
jgi:hypothetical protein